MTRRITLWLLCVLLVSADSFADATISSCTNSSPIVCTTQNSFTIDRYYYYLSGVIGLTAANGVHSLSPIDQTHFSIDWTTGSGTYSGGGTVIVPHVFAEDTADPAAYTKQVDLWGYDSSHYWTQNGVTWARWTSDNVTFTPLNGDPRNPSVGGTRYALAVADPGYNVDFEVMGPRVLVQSTRSHTMMQALASTNSGERWTDIQGQAVTIDDPTIDGSLGVAIHAGMSGLSGIRPTNDNKSSLGFDDGTNLFRWTLVRAVSARCEGYELVSPVGNGRLYADASGALTYQGPQGTVTRLASP